MLLNGLQSRFIWIRRKAMSELNYKELQEQGVFDIPYKAFEYMDNQHKRLKELEMINFDSELHFDAAKERIDLLQKRIDDALEKCYTGIRKQGGNYYLELIEGILKGDTK